LDINSDVFAEALPLMHFLSRDGVFDILEDADTVDEEILGNVPGEGDRAGEYGDDLGEL